MELREEFRLENREAFANIWSDFAAGLTLLILLVVNPEQVNIQGPYICPCVIQESYILPALEI
jgi:hypothetical protein